MLVVLLIAFVVVLITIDACCVLRVTITYVSSGSLASTEYVTPLQFRLNKCQQQFIRLFVDRSAPSQYGKLHIECWDFFFLHNWKISLNQLIARKATNFIFCYCFTYFMSFDSIKCELANVYALANKILLCQLHRILSICCILPLMNFRIAYNRYLRLPRITTK